MSKFWSSTVRKTKPYVPGEQPNEADVIKLNTNENPYPPSPKAVEAMRSVIGDDLRKYPNPTVDSLRKVIADREEVKPENVFVGNGSDEVLAFAFQAFFETNEAIRFPEITYSFYPVYAKLYDIPYQTVPLKNDFTIDVDGMCNSIGGVIFPNPNAPTGVALKLNEIEKIIQCNSNQVVIVDEAYVAFGAESAVPLIKKYPNVLITRTLSKSHALAGIRLGYAIGSTSLIEGLERIKNSFNSYTINRVTLAGAEAALQDDEYYDEMISRVTDTREWTTHQLEDLGFDVLPSQANFLFVSPSKVTAQELYESLKREKIYVRYFENLEDYIRISIGTENEMKDFVEKVRHIIESIKI
ncbi:histidinol-phosphate transaminase [Piscibacillus halophilus]|uniref:Histidinol-phosphate aminotransferase n=1 Tax=Piscibacillus halophilus TaxID=571933 RepID=A0A1H9K9Z1_9BACI|nr:histidinol-phosphate transaminase [Piscibacillus halophilus]SEQ95970.1 histidinol phosphate aminotransferase apoenzyme [Piscibacillus halophilus]